MISLSLNRMALPLLGIALLCSFCKKSKQAAPPPTEPPVIVVPPKVKKFTLLKVTFNNRLQDSFVIKDNKLVTWYRGTRPTDFTYDQEGRMIRKVWYQYPQSREAENEVSVYTYFPDKILCHHTLMRNGKAYPRDSLKMTLDQGRITSRMFLGPSSATGWQYTHDKHGNLILQKFVRSSAGPIDYGFSYDTSYRNPYNTVFSPLQGALLSFAGAGEFNDFQSRHAPASYTEEQGTQYANRREYKYSGKEIYPDFMVYDAFFKYDTTKYYYKVEEQ